MDKPQTVILTLLAGSLSAGLVVFPAFFSLPGLLIFSYFSSLPLFLIGLSLGLPPLYGAFLLANALVFLGESSFEAAQFFLQTLLGPVFLINRALLYRTDSAQKRTWYPSSELLKALTLALALIAFIVLGVYFYMIQGVEPINYVEKLFNLIDPQNQAPELRPLFLKLLPLFPSLLALSWALMVLINGTLAQGLLVRFQKNLRPSPSMTGLKLPSSFSFAFLGFVGLSFLGGGSLEIFAKNGACILAFPLFMVGLGIIHRWVYKTTFTTLALTCLYLLLLFFWPIFIVIGLGALKPWIERFD